MVYDGEVGERIRALRMRSGLSQAALARRAGIGQTSVSAIETGKQSPTVDTLERICQALGVALEQFFCKQGNVDLVPLHMQDLMEMARRLTDEQVASLVAFLRSVTNRR